MDRNGQADRIASAFQKHFFHYGYKKTNVEEVAAELQISKKTIYEHFTCKEAIFEYVIGRLAEKRITEISRRIKRYKTYREKISRLIDTIFADRREMLIQSEKQLKDKHDHEITRNIFRKSFQDFVMELVIQGYAKGEFKNDMELSHLIPFIKSLVEEGISLKECFPQSSVEADVKSAVFKLLDG